MAGLLCRRIINEPTAAAIAYGVDKKDTKKRLRCVVFDFGGGTLDVSVMSILKRTISVVAIAGDTHLGGQDFDNVLMGHCLKKHEEQTGTDLSGDIRAKARIRKACNDAKHELSTATSSTVVVESITQDEDLEVDIGLAEFE